MFNNAVGTALRSVPEQFFNCAEITILPTKSSPKVDDQTNNKNDNPNSGSVDSKPNGEIVHHENNHAQNHQQGSVNDKKDKKNEKHSQGGSLSQAEIFELDDESNDAQLDQHNTHDKENKKQDKYSQEGSHHHDKKNKKQDKKYSQERSRHHEISTNVLSDLHGNTNDKKDKQKVKHSQETTVLHHQQNYE
jgi:hypothetical protein